MKKMSNIKIGSEEYEKLSIKAEEKYNSLRNERFYKTIPIPNYIKKEDLDFYTSKYRNNKSNSMEVGQHFIFQKIIDNRMSIPIIATFVGYSICDQALEINYIIPKRLWEYNKSESIIEEFKIFYLNIAEKLKVESIIEWNDYICIFGIWDKKPTWKEMKLAMKETFYYKLSRKDKINRLLTY